MIGRHIALMLLLIAAAAAAGFALVPGERERWTMLARDGRNEEARQILEARYDAGGRDPAMMLQLYRLLMSDAQVPRATRLIEEIAAQRSRDVETLAMLAKHYGDTQDRQGQARTLERLNALAPSPEIADDLLSRYRLDGAAAQEEKLLAVLLAKGTIAVGDSERLGLLALAHDDLAGARAALDHFDAAAAPENMTGRFALFDLLLRTGDKPQAFARASDWIVNLRKTKLDAPVDPDGPAVQLAEWMVAADPSAAREKLCQVMAGDAAFASYEQAQEVDCSAPAPEVPTASAPAVIAALPVRAVARIALRRHVAIIRTHASVRSPASRHPRNILRQHVRRIASRFPFERRP